jgi:hypothetical protein
MNTHRPLRTLVIAAALAVAAVAALVIEAASRPWPVGGAR